MQHLLCARDMFRKLLVVIAFIFLILGSCQRSSAGMFVLVQNVAMADACSAVAYHFRSSS